MTAAVLNFVLQFDQLSDDDQREATREILRRAKCARGLPLSDAGLTILADELFLEMDQQEANP